MAKVAPRLIMLKVGAVDVSDQISKAVITSKKADSDFMSFASARSGGSREYALNMTIAQDHVAATLWDQIWSNAGGTATGLYAPYGNASPSVSQPHYTFSAIIAEPEGDFLGGEADDSATAVATVDVSWSLTAKPTKVTT